MKRETMTVTLEGLTMTFETGKVARQAAGAVMLTVGDTKILSTACASPQPVEGADFLPLRVDYNERFSSAGKTLSGFIKREGRPVEKEILVSRLIDRSIRPVFEAGYAHDVQVLSSVLSYDENYAPEPLGICAAGAALLISDIPFMKAIAGVRVGFIDGKFVLNPSNKQLENSRLDVLIAGSVDAVLMIEGHCDFLTDEEVLEGIVYGHTAIQEICRKMQEWKLKVGKEKKLDTLRVIPDDVKTAVSEIARTGLVAAIGIQDKEERGVALKAVSEVLMGKLFPVGGEEPRFERLDVTSALKKLTSAIMRELVLESNIRCDGRKTTEIRCIDIEHGLLPKAHGSALFTRGETQAIAVCTLGGESSAQRFETINEDSSRKFYLQYSFPPYSVGEVGRMGPPGRREVGHGKLAERALLPIVPSQEDFPYVIRLESNITESNGSSSMASVCGGCIAMMDAGVPVKRPVSGIAMGLILEKDRFVILSDILGIEDALGDMDFKVTGDAEGITAFQMDIKVEGITPEIMKAALAQAREGREHILGKMIDACPKSLELAEHAPRIERIQVKSSKIAVIIGPGGKMIRSIIEQTGADINIDDSGIVSIASSDREGMAKARALIEGLVEEIQIGKIYHGKVAAVVAFGLFVEILPGKEGLCHVSELTGDRIQNVADHFKEGEEISVKVIDINERGQLKLSRRAAMEELSKV